MKKKPTALLAAAIVTILTATSGVGTATAATSTPRIIGGSPASEAYPFMASLQHQPDPARPIPHRCGATLIKPKWLITAAHCVARPDGTLLEATKYLVKLGSTDYQAGTAYQIEKFVAHPLYDGQTADIALIKLRTPVPWPVIGSASQPVTGTAVRTIGWGRTDQDDAGSIPRQLRQLDSTVLAYEKCIHGDPYDITPGDICVESPKDGTANPCAGDSGGPLLVSAGSAWRMVGVVSRGPGETGCLNGPTVYTSTAHYWNWLDTQSQDDHTTSALAAGVEKRSLYIVQTVGTPLAAYQGTNARRHREQLTHSREQVWATIQGGQKVYDYDTAFNGFAARLTGAQAAALRQTAGVVHVWKSQPRKLETMSTPTFLGLTGAGGVWQRQYGGDHRAGEGVIIGMVDSGFWPENPSFAALPEPRPDAAIIAQKWKGSCDPGADVAQNNVSCNNKVIGARYFRAGSGPIVDEFNSPRDYAGHGSHTTSTAAGNHGVDVVVGGTSRGKASGMAPAARIAVYKACFVNFCEEADSVAAINQAVADGVDVINYSISGARDTVVDPIEIAFYNAARAGVFVATSAGNGGPGTSAVAHNSPWLTTVAAGRHDRASTATVTLGNGTVLTGSGLTDALPQRDLVLSDNVGLAGAPITRVQQCYPGQLDPAKATGKIVACATGGPSLVNKSVAVQQAGGAGMIVYNINPNHDETVSVFYRVPTVQVRNADLATLTAYAATPGAKAALSSGRQYVQRAPVVATFSSTGPAVAGGGDLLKPDITAPGVDVVAAVAPPGNAGLNHQSYQGTSMASPHIAGIAALIMGKHPTWHPSWVKSALMTTATQTDNAGRPITRGHGSTEATPFDLGAGHVLAERAFDPGLVYAATPRDWVSYMCALGQGQQIGQDCAGVPTIDPSDLNYPTIAVGDLAGTQTVHRRLTNTTGKEVRYTSTVAAPAGTTVTVTPANLVVPAGGSVAVQVKITRTDATLGSYTFGSLTWSDQFGHKVRSPIAVRPVAH